MHKITIARTIFCLICGLLSGWLSAQASTTPIDTTDQGGWALMEVSQGDTIYSLSLRQVFITARRAFKDTEERSKYNLYKRSAKVVYPYAIDAIKLYEEIQEETADLSKRKKRKHIKRTHKDLKDDFEDKLKQLTRTQGYVLVEMIERQTGKSFFDILKETRGGGTAAYWNTLSKLYGYELKNQYTEGADPLLDEVLLDYDFGVAIYRY
jgi:Domain of unknown function (DUF4294)